MTDLTVTDHTGQSGDAVVNLRQPVSCNVRLRTDAEQNRAAQQQLYELQLLFSSQIVRNTGRTSYKASKHLFQELDHKMKSAAPHEGVSQ